MEQESGIGSLILWGTVAVFFIFMSGYYFAQFKASGSYSALLLAGGQMIFGITELIRFKKTKLN
ncbi:hypothetical protein [Lacticaseibacillus sharpeae]|uniref:Uncharacterized protein n=1 Tax=Lacticaseibacillus sharpeae JCM 1186 = DSM 20505 TaxID=1291052 RepID=A0A0R1ZM78_9LACO|nr:hypothetical protein [Lacticaseibacillus sharpeae]KRM55573.1 hypothetical protein FC18_GL001190 [Lacticaseibacillus sharpeae JCM 1186 = DSM 20505]